MRILFANFKGLPFHPTSTNLPWVCTVWVINLKWWLLLWFKSSLKFSHAPVNGFCTLLLILGYNKSFYCELYYRWNERKIWSDVQQRNTGLCMHCSSPGTQMVRMTWGLAVPFIPEWTLALTLKLPDSHLDPLRAHFPNSKQRLTVLSQTTVLVGKKP